MKLCAAALFCLLVVTNASPQQKNLDALIDHQLPGLVATYKSLHAAPELSHNEDKTSALLAERLRSFGYDVTEHIGKYEKP